MFCSVLLLALLAAPSALVSERLVATQQEGHVALMAASREGRVDAVELLLTKGADINATDHAGNTALMVASMFGHTEVAQLLLASGADVHAKCAKDQGGMTALTYAIEKNDAGKLLVSFQKSSLLCLDS